MDKDPDLQLFGQVPSLLATKDDTTRFVGLTILRTILDSREDVRQNEQAIRKIWQTIPKTFLVRLLKSPSSEKVTVELAKDLKHLAVGIVHTFLCLLIPNLDQLETEEVIPLNIPLIKALPSLEAPQRILTWQVLQRIAETPKQNTLFSAKTLPPEFWDFIYSDEGTLEHALKVFRLSRLAWGPGRDNPLFMHQVNIWNSEIGELLQSEAHAAQVFEMLAEVISTGFLDEEEIQTWLPKALLIQKKQILSLPTAQLIHASISLSATLLQDLPPSANFPSLLFLSSGADSSSTTNIAFAKLFPNILITEIRSSIPSLMSSLNQPSYPFTSLHLSRTFDLLTAFISILMADEEDDENDDDEETDDRGNDEAPQAIHHYYDPESLLKFQSDITETLSLSIEFMRDRYDAAKGGTRGLHHKVRAPDAKIAAEAKTGPLPLAWDASALPISKDPLMLAILRALALWLAEDDGSRVTQLTIGILDVLVELFEDSHNAGNHGEIDFRNEILVILESLFEGDDEVIMIDYGDDDDNDGRRGSNGVIDEFLSLNGWEVLSRSVTVEQTKDGSGKLREWTLVRILMIILNSGAAPTARESWMSIVRTGASRARDPFYTSGISCDHDLTKDNVRVLEDEVAVYLLAVALVLRAPSRKRILYLGDLKVIEVRVKEIFDIIKSSVELENLNEDLEEIMGGMEELGIK